MYGWKREKKRKIFFLNCDLKRIKFFFRKIVGDFRYIYIYIFFWSFYGCSYLQDLWIKSFLQDFFFFLILPRYNVIGQKPIKKNKTWDPHVPTLGLNSPCKRQHRRVLSSLLFRTWEYNQMLRYSIGTKRGKVNITINAARH